MNFNERISGYNSWNEERQKLRKIISLLEENGLKPKAGSRLYRYQRILETLGNQQSNNLPKDFNDKKFYQIPAEIHQLYHGIVELNQSATFNEWRKKLVYLVSGNELPEDDQDHTPRNYQFELYIAGLLKKSGLEPVCAEPDVVINRDGRNFGIAIKRPNSFSNLKGNLRKARKQIVKTNQPGIVFVDVTRISNEENPVVQADTISAVTDKLIRYLDYFFEKNYHVMENIIHHELVFGIVLHTSCVCSINGFPGHSSRTTFRNLCSEESPLMRDLHFLAQALMRSFQ